MKPEHRDAWTPQEPSPDFADRTVAALLGERARWRPRASKGWIAGGLIAAVLVSGAAFGLTAIVHRPVPAPVAPPAPPRSEPPHDESLSRQAPTPVDRVEAPPAPTQELPHRAQRRETLSPGADAGSRAPVGAKFPRCDCSVDQVICTCF